MTPRRLREILAAYGADPRRWPGDERAAALALLAASPAARRQAEEARALDAVLDRAGPPVALALDAQALAARIAAAPREPRHAGAPARLIVGWPSFAGLAAAAAAGFVAGWLGLAGAVANGGDDPVQDVTQTEIEPW